MNKSAQLPDEIPVATLWFDEAFPILPYKNNKTPGSKEMLIILGYDISDRKRLAQVAQTCENFGTRVQYSLFECRLDERSFDILWSALQQIIDPDEDRIVAYRLDARSATNTLTAGTMVCTEKAICYIV